MKTLHNRIQRKFYRVVTIFPTRTKARKPWGWNNIQGALQGRMEETHLGLMITIETTDLAEAFQIRETIRSNKSRWEKDGTFTDIDIAEVLQVEQLRRVDDSENVLAPNTDALWKRKFVLAAGVPFNEEWIQEDQQAALEARAQRELDETRVRELKHRYLSESDALRDENARAYFAAQDAGEKRHYHEWMRERPMLPSFEEWREAVEAGKEPRLLLPAAPVVEVVDERAERDRAEAEAAERMAKAKAERTDEFFRRVMHLDRPAKKKSPEPETETASPEPEDETEIAQPDVETETPAESPAPEKVAAAEEDQDAYDRMVYEFFDRDRPHQTFSGLVERIKGVPEESIRRAANRLIAEGRVTEDAEGLHWIKQNEEPGSAGSPD